MVKMVHDAFKWDGTLTLDSPLNSMALARAGIMPGAAMVTAETQITPDDAPPLQLLVPVPPLQRPERAAAPAKVVHVIDVGGARRSRRAQTRRTAPLGHAASMSTMPPAAQPMEHHSCSRILLASFLVASPLGWIHK